MQGNGCEVAEQTLFTLPVYRDLKMDQEANYHTSQRLMANPEKWAQVQDPNSEGRMMYQGMLVELARFADRLLNFRGQVGQKILGRIDLLSSQTKYSGGTSRSR